MFSRGSFSGVDRRTSRLPLESWPKNGRGHSALLVSSIAKGAVRYNAGGLLPVRVILNGKDTVHIGVHRPAAQRQAHKG